MSQIEAIKKHLQQGRPITPLEALQQYGCLRLAARISDLRDAGMNIRTDIIELNDKRFAKYTLS